MMCSSFAVQLASPIFRTIADFVKPVPLMKLGVWCSVIFLKMGTSSHLGSSLIEKVIKKKQCRGFGRIEHRFQGLAPCTVVGAFAADKWKWTSTMGRCT
jgi:hypothetical protein